MYLFANLKEYAQEPILNPGFAGLFEQVKHTMVAEPLLAHLCALNGHPRKIPFFYRRKGVGEESLLFFKWQLSCFHHELSEPKLFKYPCFFFERNAAAAYWHWLRSIVTTILRTAPPCQDPRFNPLAIYWTARYIDSLNSAKTIKLVF